MLEDRLKPMEESYGEGIKMLEEKKYDAAIKFFRHKLESGTPLAHSLAYYGLATALYQKKNVSLTQQETQEIISQYQESIARDPNFADAYFMCSCAYDHLAVTYVDEARDHEEARAAMLTKARDALAVARQQLSKALELNLLFKETAHKYERLYDKTESLIRAVEMFKKGNR